MKTFSLLRSGVLAAIGTAIASPYMFGAMLPPGGSASPDVFTQAETTAALASVMGNINPNPGVSFNANYTEAVYANPNNVFCAGCLDFVINLTNLGPGVVERITLASFTGFSVDAGYFSPTTGVTPNIVDRSGGGGAVVGFSFFANNITANQSSATLVVQTNAKFYTNGPLSVQDGYSGFNSGLAPTATPEPLSTLLLGSGLVLLGSKRLFGRKRVD